MFSIIALVIVVVGLYVYSLLWSSNQLGIDLIDASRLDSETDQSLYIRNKFLDQLRLIFWKAVRSTQGQTDHENFKRIANSPNEDFYFWSVSYWKSSMHLEMIDSHIEGKTGMSHFTFCFPKEMKWRIIKLFLAYRWLA